MSQPRRESPQSSSSSEDGTYSDPGYGVAQKTGPRLNPYQGYQWNGENLHGLNFPRFKDGRLLRVQPYWATEQRHVKTPGIESVRSGKATLSVASPVDVSRGTSCAASHSHTFTESDGGTDLTTSSAYLIGGDSSGSSTAQLIPRKSHQDSRSGEAGRGRVPWTSCAPAIGVLALAVILLMSAVSTMAGTKRLLLSFPINRVRELPPLEEFTAESGLKANASTKTGAYPDERWSKFFAGAHRHKITTTPVFEILETDATTVTTAISRTREAKIHRKRRTSRGRRTTSAHPTDNFVEVDIETADKDFMSFPSSHPKRPMCGAVFYTYCSRSPWLQFHFRRAANACVLAEADTLHLCNRGANRFASARHCRQSCVSAKRPDRACYDEPLFTSCARQDVLSSWWHLRGNKCVPWSFPAVGCPASGSDVFRTAHECEKHCKGPRRHRQCRPPDVVSCTASHLKYPFFAHAPEEGGRVRCLRSSVEAMRGHRCLTGANQFHSLEACLVSCRNKPRV